MKKENQSLTEVLSISDAKDFSVNIRASKPKKIPTKTVSLYLEDMDIRDTINQPFLFIILPFFTSKRQRNVNLVYEIANAGIKFGSSLSTDDFEGIKNQQPSDFEKNVFYFIMYKFQELLMDKTKEENYIVFNIEEVIGYLGLKFSMKYYRKMEETLYNLQATTYKIVIRNRKKAGNIIREVYKEPLNLIKYEKVKERNAKTNKMKVYYKVKLDERIIEELKRKHYSIFDRHLLNDLRKTDKAAEKIYQYISMKRFSDDIGDQRIETLATIIPLATKSRIKKVLKDGTVKDYEVSKMKQVLKRIKKCFDVLVNKGYLVEYRVEEIKDIKSYRFIYAFDKSKDNECHISSLIKVPNKIENKSGKTLKTKEGEDEIDIAISKAKKNIFVAKAWNKRVDNKIDKLLKEEGLVYTKHILKIVKESLNREITKTLVSYINGVMKKVGKNIESDEVLIPEIVEDKERVEGKKTAKVKNTYQMELNLEDPISKLLCELYEKMTQDEKEDILTRARERYLDKTNTEKFDNMHDKIFNSMKKSYIIQILKEDKGL